MREWGLQSRESCIVGNGLLSSTGLTWLDWTEHCNAAIPLVCNPLHLLHNFINNVVKSELLAASSSETQPCTPHASQRGM